MKIGIDFDNTLVKYNLIFDRIAKDLKLKNDRNSKKVIKDYFINNRGEIELWKATQAFVYGDRIKEAYFLPDFVDFYQFLIAHNIDLYIISHKTEFAHFKERKVSLHNAAKSWIDKNLSFLNKENIFFENTEIKKVGRIKSLNLDYFVDDLTNILNHKNFPVGVKKVLMIDIKDDIPVKRENYLIVQNWTQVINLLNSDLKSKSLG